MPLHRSVEPIIDDAEQQPMTRTVNNTGTATDAQKHHEAADICTAALCPVTGIQSLRVCAHPVARLQAVRYFMSHASSQLPIRAHIHSGISLFCTILVVFFVALVCRFPTRLDLGSGSTKDFLICALAKSCDFAVVSLLAPFDLLVESCGLPLLYFAVSPRISLWTQDMRRALSRLR